MQKISETLKDKGFPIMIFGRSGSGKTAACRTLPPEETYWISYELDQTAACLHGWGWDQWNCETPLGYFSTLHEIAQIKKDPKIKYVVVDTISGYVEQLLDEYRRENDNKTAKQLGFAIWQTAGERLLDTVTKYQELCALGKDVIFLCHLQYREEGEKDTKKIYREPMLFGKLPEKVCKRIPVVLIAKNFKIGPTTHYTLSTTGNEGDYGTDKFKILDNTQENDIKKILDRLREGLGLPTTTIATRESDPKQTNTTSGEKPTSNTTPALPPVTLPKKTLTDKIYALGDKLRKDPALIRMEVRAKFDRPMSSLKREELREYGDILEAQVEAQEKSERQVF